jgi:hypothetical protein
MYICTLTETKWKNDFYKKNKNAREISTAKSIHSEISRAKIKKHLYVSVVHLVSEGLKTADLKTTQAV